MRPGFMLGIVFSGLVAAGLHGLAQSAPPALAQQTDSSANNCPGYSATQRVTSAQMSGTPTLCGSGKSATFCNFKLIEHYAYDCQGTPGSNTRCEPDPEAVIRRVTDFICVRTPVGPTTVEECVENVQSEKHGFGLKTVPCN